MPHSLIAASLIRVSIAALWLLAPPALVVIALRNWTSASRENVAGLKAVWPVLVGVAVLVNWLLFVAFVLAGQIGGFGTHYVTTRLADIFLLVSVLLLVGSIAARVGRWQLSLASVLILALWVGSEFVA